MISLYSAFYYKNKISIIAVLRKDFIKSKLLCDLFVDNSNLKTEAFIETLSEYYSYISVKIISPKLKLINGSKVKVLFKINENFFGNFLYSYYSYRKKMKQFSKLKTKIMNQFKR
jgi:hypothetical protein